MFFSGTGDETDENNNYNNPAATKNPEFPLPGTVLSKYFICFLQHIGNQVL